MNACNHYSGNPNSQKVRFIIRIYIYFFLLMDIVKIIY